MNILQVTPYFPPYYDYTGAPYKISRNKVCGGAETYALNLSLELVKLNNGVTVYTSKPPIKAQTSRKDSILSIKRFNAFFMPFLDDDPIMPTLPIELLKNDFDIIHAETFWHFSTYSSLYTSKLQNLPIIVSHLGGVGRTFKHHIYFRIISKLLKHADFITQLSKSSWKFYINDLKIPEEKLRIIPGGVVVHEFAHIKDKDHLDQLRERLGIKGSDFIVLFVGRLLPHKGVDVLIRAINHFDDCKLLIVGRGDPIYESLLKKISNEKTVFVGRVTEDDLPYYFNLCDITVLSSVHNDCYGNYEPEPEAFGLVLVEAMACGKPVVGSDIPGINEVITPDTGFLFPEGDNKALSQVIEQLKDDGLRKEMGQNARRRAEKVFSWNAVAKEYIKLYHEAMEKHG
ncbi:MAG: glycosyltransferase family 4 protein [Thermoplasmata archaeon]|nr:MAG: glycosyltransferase family 4 protein [Thermoplasmata archaeon]